MKHDLVHGGAVDGVDASTVVGQEESLQRGDAVAQHFLRAVPGYIQSDIRRGTVGVGIEMPMIGLVDMRLSVIIRVFSVHAGPLVAGHLQIATACGGCLMPKWTVFFVGFFGEYFIEVRQMVGRIAPLGFRNELDELVVGIPHGLAVVAFALMDAISQDLASPCGIFVDILAITPATGGEEQVHREIFLAVRCRTIRVRRTVRRDRPCEIMRMMTVLHVHVTHYPAPQLVEYVLTVVLQGDHHRIAHTLGTYIVVAGVHHIGKTFVVLPIEFVRTFENFMPDL